MIDSDDKGFFTTMLVDVGIGTATTIFENILGSLFGSWKSFNGHNQLINKSTGQAMTCHELKTFLIDQYNQYQQNPSRYQQQYSYPDQNMGDGHVGYGGYGEYGGNNYGQWGYGK